MLEQAIVDTYIREAENLTDRVDYLNGKITQDTFHICTLINSNSTIYRPFYNPRWLLDRTKGPFRNYIEKATYTITDVQQFDMINMAIDIASAPSIKLPVGMELNLGTIAVVDERVLAALYGTTDLDGSNTARILKRLLPLRLANRYQQ